MSLVVLDPGLQCTVQAAPRTGYRHAGVPMSGPADSVSMALANCLVGRAPSDACLEITYGAARFRFETAMQIGVAGAATSIRIGGVECQSHQTLEVQAGDIVEVGPVTTGARVYLGVSGELQAHSFLGSKSTYLPAAFGGIDGRALREGDRVNVSAVRTVKAVATPEALRFPILPSFAFRVVPGPDLPDPAYFPWGESFAVSARLSRMGAEIEGSLPVPEGGGALPSSAVFPGALQVTPQGKGYLLLVDGQTTGGYPHLLQVIRADRHLLGQLRPGSRVRFLYRTQDRAEADLRAKQAMLQDWLPGFRL
jgi:5-oxoprolinase (ATP-hydrolysing) subunit C